MKNFGIKIAIAVFAFSIFGLAVSTSVNSVFGTPDKLKQSLVEGEIYQATADSIVTEAIEKADAKSDIPLNNKAVQKAAREAVTPGIIQKNSEKAIDGTYDWLEGETKTPEFKLDIQDIKNDVAANVADAGSERVKNLPACTFAQLQQIDTSSVDPFSLPCQPPGLNLATLEKQYAQRVARSDDFLKDPTLTANDIKDKNGQNVFADAAGVPEAFQFGQKLPWIFGVLAIICAALVILLHANRAQGMKSLSLTLILVAVAVFLMLVATTLILGTLNPEINGPDNVALQDASLVVIKSLTSALNRILLIFGSIYAVLGVGGLISVRFLKLRSTAKSPEHINHRK